MTTREEVSEFLKRVRDAKEFKLLRMFPTSLNHECLLQLGISEANVAEEIRSLEECDYSKGPEEDLDREGQQVWIFSRCVKGTEVYVKIILSGNTVRILSFHLAESPLKRPFEKKP